MNINQLASISSGINQRKNPQGTVYYLGGSDFTATHLLDPLLEPSVMYSKKLEKHYLQKGDLLIISKGHHGFIAHCYQGIKQPAVASSIFLVLKNIHQSVLPEYLAWYINLEKTQIQLIKLGRGSALPAINKTILGDITIRVPNIKTQEYIVALDKLKKLETNIIQQLDDLKASKLQILLNSKLQ